MPRKDAQIRARTTKKLKKQAEKILEQFGVTPSQAINMFYSNIVLYNEVPHSIGITAKELREGDISENYTKIRDDDHLKEILGLSDD